MIPIPSSLTLIAGAFVVGVSSGWYLTADYKDAKLAEAILENAKKVNRLEAKAEARIEDAKNEYVETITKIKSSADDLNAELGRLRVKRCERMPVPTRPPERIIDTTNSESNGNREVETNLDGVASEIIRLGIELDEANAKIVALQSAIRAYMKMASPK